MLLCDYERILKLFSLIVVWNVKCERQLNGSELLMWMLKDSEGTFCIMDTGMVRVGMMCDIGQRQKQTFLIGRNVHVIVCEEYSSMRLLVTMHIICCNLLGSIDSS